MRTFCLESLGFSGCAETMEKEKSRTAKTDKLLKILFFNILAHRPKKIIISTVSIIIQILSAIKFSDAESLNKVCGAVKLKP